VTEVGSSGLTKLLISRENELDFRGSPRGGPSEGRAGNQRDQPESSDKCLHDTSPCLDHRPRLCISVEADWSAPAVDRPALCVVRGVRKVDQGPQCLFPAAHASPLLQRRVNMSVKVSTWTVTRSALSVQLDALRIRLVSPLAGKVAKLPSASVSIRTALSSRSSNEKGTVPEGRRLSAHHAPAAGCPLSRS
jgi:hypothetical protein